jgi:phosphopantothenoylcysteine decarboxylase/phosphopantothenate--cysteine ligase
MENFKGKNITVMTAAVADYKPAVKQSEKIKKKQKALTIKLAPTNDILFELGQMKTKTQFLCGFALETENAMSNAMLKLKRKNLDMIVVNSPKDVGAGFQADTNKISIIDPTNKVINFDLKSKKEVANDVVNYIIERLIK